MRFKNNISVKMNLTTMRLIKIGPNKIIHKKNVTPHIAEMSVRER